jgi:hypothetical protein
MHEDHCPGLHACPLCAKIAPRLGHAAPLAGSSVSQDGSEYSLPGRYSSAPRSSARSIVEKISVLLPGDKSDLPHAPHQACEKPGERSCGQHYAAPRQDVCQPTGIPEKDFSDYVLVGADGMRAARRDVNLNPSTQSIRSQQASSVPFCRYRGAGACRRQPEWASAQLQQNPTKPIRCKSSHV